jgi:Ras-related protein Rab-21
MLSPGSHFRFRIVLIGDPSVGKTSLLSQLVDHKFSAIQTPTVGANYQIYPTRIDSLDVELQIWDTAGQERFRALGPIYYRYADAAVAVYDVTNHESFDALETWIRGFFEVAGTRAKVAIVGNKSDLGAISEVTKSEAEEFAERNGFTHFQSSAKTGEGVEIIFESLARTIFPECENPFAKPQIVSRSILPCSCTI